MYDALALNRNKGRHRSPQNLPPRVKNISLIRVITRSLNSTIDLWMLERVQKIAAIGALCAKIEIRKIYSPTWLLCSFEIP